MTHPKNTSSLTSSKPTPKHRVNWHEAAACAIQIELRDFEGFLEFYSEYTLGKNYYRIDLLVIRMLSEHPIPKNIARCFKTYNKTIGYAALLLDQINSSGQYTSLDISISFLSFHYPRKLIFLLKSPLTGYIISIMKHLKYRLSSHVNCRRKRIFTCAV